MPLVVRTARPTDLEFIVEANERLAWETEQRELDRELLGEGVAAVLADARRGRYYVVDDGDGPVGQLLLTYEWSDWRNGWFWWIQSVYVVPDARNDGVFSLLFRHVRDLAHADSEVCGLRLYVEYENATAQAIYAHLGMQEAGYRVLEIDFMLADDD